MHSPAVLWYWASQKNLSKLLYLVIGTKIPSSELTLDTSYVPHKPLYVCKHCTLISPIRLLTDRSLKVEGNARPL
jgi:hypothetical protein